jgi:hypothetical protein
MAVGSLSSATASTPSLVSKSFIWSTVWGSSSMAAQPFSNTNATESV